jgi:anti-anti-sigma factor
MSNSGSASSDLFTIRIDQGLVVLSPLDKTFLNAQAREFNRLYEEFSRQGQRHFVLDFSNCDYISSEGLNITAQYWKMCKDAGGRLMVVVPELPQSGIRELFDLLGLSKMLGDCLQPTVTDALAFPKN